MDNIRVREPHGLELTDLRARTVYDGLRHVNPLTLLAFTAFPSDDLWFPGNTSERLGGTKGN